jgi:hypothetical protein
MQAPSTSAEGNEMYEANLGNGKTIKLIEDKYLVVTIYQGVLDTMLWMSKEQAAKTWRGINANFLEYVAEYEEDGTPTPDTSDWWRNESVPDEWVDAFGCEESEVHTWHVDDIQSLDEINAARG